MTEQEARKLLQLLWPSVERLGQSAGEQLAWLNANALTLADELALEFDDIFPTVGGLIQRGVVASAAFAPLAGVDEMLTAMSEVPSKWELAALDTDPDWIELRRRARIALASLTAAA